MCAEWNAWLTRSRDVLRPLAFTSSASSITACSSPAITVAFRPFTDATSTPSRSHCRTSASDASSDTIAPPRGSPCISRPRAATSVQASRSDHSPATCAAASSPIE